MVEKPHYEALYRRWRPQTFAEIIGQEHIAKTLANAVDSGRVAHAYLFCGPRGTGKTSTARILAKALNCQKGPTSKPCGECNPCVEIAAGSSLDVIEVDAASYRQVDETQEVLKGVRLAPAGDRRKIYIIDEVHMLSSHSFNALLKTLEEPPDHIVFVLATTEPHRILPTVLSRCQRFDFHRVSVDLLANHLKAVSRAEGIDIADEAISLVARRSEGSVRDALGALEQLSEFTGGARIELSDANRLFGAIEIDTLIKLIDHLDEGRAADALRLVQEVLEAGREVRSFTSEIVGHLRRIFLLQNAGEAASVDLPEDELQKVKEQAEKLNPRKTPAFLEAFGDAFEKSRGPEARLALEIAIVKMAKPGMNAALDGILNRLENLEAVISAISEGRPLLTSNEKSAEDAPRIAKTEEATEKATSSSEDLQKIADLWEAIVERVREEKPPARAFLIEARPVSFENGRLVLEFHPSSGSFHREKVEGEYAGLVKKAIKTVAGVDVSLECRLGKSETRKTDSKEGALSLEEVVEFITGEFDAKIIEGQDDDPDEIPAIEEDR